MRQGLIGKLASKPDYVAIDAPRELLACLEPWLHAGVAASRLELGESWRAAFLAAPIWRFWLGAEVCGETILGALTPSIDSGRRYFPLAIFAAPGPGLAIPPPEFDDHGVWFAAAEALLLSTLAPGALFGQAEAALTGLAPPAAFPPDAAPAPVAPIRGGQMAPLDDKPAGQVFALLRRAGWAAAYANRSFWWTAGGAGYRPLALAFRLMPDPSLFAALLTGHFSGDARNAVG
jgi:type VI secretion system protein ImpM